MTFYHLNPTCTASCHGRKSKQGDCGNSISSPSIWNLDMVVLSITYAPFRSLHGHMYLLKAHWYLGCKSENNKYNQISEHTNWRVKKNTRITKRTMEEKIIPETRVFSSFMLFPIPANINAEPCSPLLEKGNCLGPPFFI